MNMQEQIIALLNGDLSDAADVHALFGALASSPEEQHLLVKHIALMRKVHSLSGTIAPTPQDDQDVMNKISELHQARNNKSWQAGAALLLPQSSNERFSRRSVYLVGAVALMIGIMFGIVLDSKLLEGEPGHFADADLIGAGLEHDGESRTFNRGDSSVIAGELPPDTSTTIASPSEGLLQSSGHFQNESYGRNVATRQPSATTERVNQSGMINIDGIVPDQVYRSGQFVPIKWNHSASNEPKYVRYSLDSGDSWNTIASGIGGTSLIWNIPSVVRDTRALLSVSQGNLAGLTVKSEVGFDNDTTMNMPAFSRDGSKVVACDWRGAIKVIDVASGRLLRTIRGHDQSVLQVIFSTDDSKIISTSLDGTARIWDVATGKELHRIFAKEGVAQVIWTVAASPTEGLLAFGNDNGTVTIWDLEAGDELYTFEARQQAIREIHFSPDGRRIYVASSDGTAGIYDMESGEELQLFIGHRALVNAISIPDDGSIAVTCSFDGNVMIWDANSGALRQATPYFKGRRVSKVAISPDGTLIAIGGFDADDVLLADRYSGEVVGAIPLGDRGKDITAFPIFSGDSKSLMIAHGTDFSIWNVEKREAVVTLMISN